MKMKCQCCGTQQYEHHVTTHELMGLDLCMRCTDKLLSLINGRDVDEFWDAEAAERNGYEPFVVPSQYVMEFLRRRVKLMSPVRQLDYNFIRGFDFEEE